MEKTCVKDAIPLILTAQAVIVIIGTGVSVAAGIPAFYGKRGIEVKTSNGGSVEDQMSAGVMSKTNTLAEHCKLFASLAKKSILAEPTHFHNFLWLLDQKNKLKRIYTQNIDGIESRAGFDLISEVDGRCMRCIPLYGSLLQLCCTVCSARRPLENYFHDLESGILPSCGSCEARVKKISAGTRLTDSGSLRPEIRLYDEEMGPGKIIMDIVSADARSISKGDALVVVGTNLDMPGIIQIIQTIGTAIDEIAGHAIYIDLKAPPTFLSKQFSHFVQGDCQEFAMGAIDKLNDGERDKLVECTYIEEMERRRDMRPLWDWM